MLGQEPQKRSKGGVTKSKSTKQKKDHKDLNFKLEENIKSEAGLDKPFGKQMGIAPHNIKHEPAQSPFQSPFATASAMSPSVESSREAALRLLTPCSDDMLAETASIVMSPAPNFDLGPCPHGDGHEPSGHDGWDQSSLYFDNAYGIDQFSTALCDHQDDSHLAHDPLLHEHTHDFTTTATAASAMQHGMPGRSQIKRESWDSQGH
jgi:hypothetical protein